jgi:hypothetical protein
MTTTTPHREGHDMTTALVTEIAETTTDQASYADTVRCPDCGQLAVVEWRTTIPSTGAPVEHVKIACPVGHRYFMPAEGLA